MGSKTVGKMLGASTGSSSSTENIETYVPQYIRLADGSMALYDTSSLDYTYETNTATPQQTNRSFKNTTGSGGAKQQAETQALTGATYNGQNVELDGGTVKLYGQTDYDNYVADQNTKQNAITTASKANTQNLSDQRTQETSQRSSVLSSRGISRGASSGSGTFQNIIS